ncbi:MAG TPA: CarD family transcriptional regulator, partial [Chitinophagaceae bacterium]
MSVKDLLLEYQNTPRLFQLADRISFAQPSRIYLKNLLGSSSEFVVAASFLHPANAQINHLVVLNDAEQAAYFHNTLESITDALDIFYFPSSFKNKKNYSLLNSSHVMLRTEALTKLAAGGREVNKKIFVTYPDALFEKVIVPGKLSSNIIHIRTGDTLHTDELLLKLSGYGFERTDFVYEPGQFAIRGGILDIYSFGNDKPYRVELFGNEVDSIRIVDPETQLSERKLLEVNIIPNVDGQIESGERISLFEFLPPNTVTWIQDYDWTKERLADAEEDLRLFLQRRSGDSAQAESSDEKLIRRSVSAEDFISVKTFDEDIARRHLLEFSHQPSPSLNFHVEIEFDTRQQPAFNRQFDMLIRDLKQWESKKFRLYLFAENPKQLERLYSIFSDLKAEIQFTPIATAIHEGFIDENLKVVCYTDHEIFQRYHKYKVRQAYNKSKALTLRTLRELQPGDYVTHIDHGVGIYSGLQKVEANGKLQEAVRIIYKDNDILYVNINSLHKIAKYTGKEGSVPRINKLGSDVWNKLKEKTKSRVKEIAFDLIKLYAQRKAQQGFKHTPDTYLQTELEASFIYEDTPDQSKATADVKKDMESPSPMDRLVCGDVGFGKTEVAIRAAFKTCVDGKQAAVLVPTTILAFQHYQTFSERLKDFPVKVDYVNRFKSAKDKKDTYKRLEEGKVDIIIGTHAL